MTLGRKILNYGFSAAMKLGAFSMVSHVTPRVLTVLNYHRVDDVSRPGFDSFVSNVSASPAVFAQQMDYVKRNYNVISCSELNAIRNGECDLPPNPLLITFDDGYYDNYSNAFPILAERKLPAVIFLATDYIDTDVPFYWDFVAYCFYHTRLTAAVLPLLGNVSWDSNTDKTKLTFRWINVAKRIAEDEKKKRISELAEVLQVDVHSAAFAGLVATWDQVREMNRSGIEMGAHTASHPILTRIPLIQVVDELRGSKGKIEEEIDKQVTCFAYPNGGPDDLSSQIVDMVHQAGFDLAFTLMRGTSTPDQIRNNPLRIHRIYLGSSDTLPRFAAKLSAASFIH
jgi:peptidoglycan/xylan/chitin deacetylase (PgdA/CDA1 family)